MRVGKSKNLAKTCTRSDSQSSPAKPLGAITTALCLKHLQDMAGTSAGCGGNQPSSCSQL